eukprot:3378884-Ditylum_brightwellii.AAC.1
MTKESDEEFDVVHTDDASSSYGTFNLKRGNLPHYTDATVGAGATENGTDRCRKNHTNHIFDGDVQFVTINIFKKQGHLRSLLPWPLLLKRSHGVLQKCHLVSVKG